jgi:uncharacterized protein YjbJ (UPF0337 family)
MTSVQTVGQNIKGNVQQAVGAVEKKLGHPVQGTMDQLKGKANVAVSNLKSEMQKTR